MIDIRWALEFPADLSSGDRLTLIAFCRFANDDGVTWVGPSKLMENTHMQVAGLRKCIKTLCRAGAMTRIRRYRKDGSEGSAFTVLHIPRAEPLDTSQYEFMLGDVIDGPNTQGLRSFGAGTPMGYAPPRGAGVVLPGDTGDGTNKGKEKRTTSSKAASRESKEAELAAGTLSVRYRSRAVPVARAQTASVLIDSYNTETGQRRQRFKPDGSLTEDFKRIIGALTDHPEVETSQWNRTMNTVLANPWWDGSPSVGVIFGPKVVDDNLSDPARGGRKRRNGPEPVIHGTKEERDANLARDLERLKHLDTG